MFPPRGRCPTRIIVVAASAATIVAAITLVISRDDTTAPADAPSTTVTLATSPPSTLTTTTATAPVDDRGLVTVLGDPSQEEIEQAEDVGTYRPGTGPTEVTGARTYVSLRTCEVVSEPCGGTRGWAYVVGSAAGSVVHAGLLGIADQLVLAALDDRFLVASSASPSQDPPAAPAAWLIDSVSGQAGALTWSDRPTTLQSPEQALVLFPARIQPYYMATRRSVPPPRRQRTRWDDQAAERPESTRPPSCRSTSRDRDGSGIRHRPPTVVVPGLAYTDDGGRRRGPTFALPEVTAPHRARPWCGPPATRARASCCKSPRQATSVAVSATWVSASDEHRLFDSSNTGRT